MRIAALYDIHGNDPALEAVLAEVAAAGADHILVGGDVVLGPCPSEVLARLDAVTVPITFLRGNTDRMLAGPLTPEAAQSPWFARMSWAASRLTPAERERIGGWPETVTLDVERLGPVLFCHGSPRSDEEILTPVTPEARVREILAGVAARVVVHGHTHIRYDRTVAGTRLVNPGSVGMPYEGEPGAFWALLGPEVALVHTRYDYEWAGHAIRRSGFPDAEEFVRENLFHPPGPLATAARFEAMAVRTAS